MTTNSAVQQLMRGRDGTIDEVERTAITTGPYDLIVEVACEDNDHLLSVVNRGLRKLPGMESMTTMTVLRSHDQRGTIDLR